MEQGMRSMAKAWMGLGAELAMKVAVVCRRQWHALRSFLGVVAAL